MNANLTRRHFILTATSAAGGLMIGIGAGLWAKYFVVLLAMTYALFLFCLLYTSRCV